MKTRHTKNALCAIMLFIAAAFALVPSVWADTLAPGGSGSPDDLLNGAGATDVGSTGNLPLSFGGTVFTGVISDPGNEFCPGCLDFEFQVFNQSANTASIVQIVDSSFAGFSTDVGINGNGEGGFFCSPVNLVAPSSVSRSSDGSTVNFNFSPGVPAGVACTGTNILQIDTNAKSFTTGTLKIIGASGVIETVESFEPTTSTSTPPPTSTPEPSSLVLLGSGLLGMVGLKWKRLS